MIYGIILLLNAVLTALVTYFVTDSGRSGEFLIILVPFYILSGVTVAAVQSLQVKKIDGK